MILTNIKRKQKEIELNKTDKMHLLVEKRVSRRSKSKEKRRTLSRKIDRSTEANCYEHLITSL